jgi:uncharacterized protein YjbI with pentapeptide repeats
LSHALLEDCDLTGANLSNAKLDHASFNRARMTGATVTDAIAAGASFKGVTGLTQAAKAYLKAKGAKGLEEIVLAPGEPTNGSKAKRSGRLVD